MLNDFLAHPTAVAAVGALAGACTVLLAYLEARKEREIQVGKRSRRSSAARTPQAPQPSENSRQP